MPARAALVAAVLLAGLAATPSTASSPQVVTHTYLVQYRLAGDYTAKIAYADDSQGYCAGTGFTETAHFDVTYTGRIRVKLDGEALAHKQLLQPVDPGTWKQEGTVVDEGSDCADSKPETCDGDLLIKGDDQTRDMLLARGKGNRVRFQFSLSGVPAEDSKATDCEADTGVSPVPDFSLLPAIKPFQAVYLDVSLESLARHTRFSGNGKPVVAVHGYSVATCDHTPSCTGALTRFVRKITVKQVS
ncbi:MAG: hypothetical protein JWM73_2096 [Solirubrobacterales bacterium]|nr:hypothetical protein [Solirubrobacterales bacterium]